jgi:hypothetical protein
MGLEKNLKDFDLFGIETHPIPPNPHGLRTKRTSPYESVVQTTMHYTLGNIICFSPTIRKDISQVLHVIVEPIIQGIMFWQATDFGELS